MATQYLPPQASNKPESELQTGELVSVKKEKQTADSAELNRIRMLSKAESASYVVNLLGFFELLPHLATLASSTLYVFGEIATAIPICRAVVDGCKNVWRALISWRAKEGKYTKGVKTFSATAGFGLTLTAVISCFMIPPLTLGIAVAASCVSAFREGWILAASLASRFKGTWQREREALSKKKQAFYRTLNEDSDAYHIFEKHIKIISIENRIKSFEARSEENGNTHLIDQLQNTRKSMSNFIGENTTRQALLKQYEDISEGNNHERALKGDLASKTHAFVLTLASVIGVALLMTPAAPVGAGILLGTAIYGIMHKFDWPGKWASRLRNALFGPKQPASIDEIKKEAAKYNIQKKLDLHEKQNEQSATPVNEEQFKSPEKENLIQNKDKETSVETFFHSPPPSDSTIHSFNKNAPPVQRNYSLKKLINFAWPFSQSQERDEDGTPSFRAERLNK